MTVIYKQVAPMELKRRAEAHALLHADTCAEIVQKQVCRGGCGASHSCRIRGNSM
jgi:hypothetical protein